MKSPTLIILQFSLLIGITFNTGQKILNLKSIGILSPAIILALWAIIAMRKSKLRISPIPANEAILIVSGPYQYIRHPMYSSILLFVIGLLVIHYSIYQLIAVILLLLVLLIKSKWEEQMLLIKFPSYKSYMERTKSIIPFLL
ncbi:MAG: isoprenylcysteine carboxyl methyltransferase [Chitinophagaceae bacterium]|nr:MAG: isoprenylcysteine carboxyl methyltransferase [Chitinophagaceae bacterium]